MKVKSFLVKEFLQVTDLSFLYTFYKGITVSILAETLMAVDNRLNGIQNKGNVLFLYEHLFSTD